MEKTYKLLFALLRFEFGFGEFDNSIIDELDAETLEELLKISKSHDIAHLVADALHKLDIKNNITEEFNKEQIKAFVRVNKIDSEIKSISRVLNEEKIDFILLKGSHLRGYYPQRWMRTSCDIDLLLHKSDAERAKQILIEKYGFTYDTQSVHDIALCSPLKVHIELHFSLIQENEFSSASKKLQHVWSYAVKKDENSFEYVFSNEFFLLYHIIHMAKHFKNGGCGVRSFLDLKIINEKLKINRDEFEKLVTQFNLNKFYASCIELMSFWFESGKNTEISQKMQQYILPAGIYGSSQNLMASKKAENKSRAKILFNKIFVPKKYLECRYPILKNKGFLLPYFEVKRWFTVFNPQKRKNAAAFIKLNNTLSDSHSDFVNDMFNELEIKNI